ncbi:hypothetical protein ACP275_14G269300 [Erythranthe tilingii]
MDSHHPNPQFFSDSLYCEEEHWDNVELLMHTTANCLTKCQGESSNSDPSSFVELWEVDELSSLLHKEQGNELHDAAGLEQNPSLAEARCEAVEWMLKVVDYYSFSALTAVLAVNYLDRFLHSFRSHTEKPWMTHLAAVSCLSLAAKVEETQVPLLLDLQVYLYVIKIQSLKKKIIARW